MSKPESSRSQTPKSGASRRRQRMIRFRGVSQRRVTPIPRCPAAGVGIDRVNRRWHCPVDDPGRSTRKLSFMEAFFTATSASAVTGLSLFPISTDLTIWGQLILLLLVQIGGVGLIVVVVLVFRLIGRQVTLGERLAVTSSLGLDRPEEIALIMVRAIGLMLAIEGVGAFLLFLHWRISGIVPPVKRLIMLFFTPSRPIAMPVLIFFMACPSIRMGSQPIH